MGKNKRKSIKESGKQADTAGQHQTGKKFKRDAKPKKAKDPRFEDIPFRLREIMKSKDRMKAGSLGAKKIKKAVVPAAAQPEDGQAGDIPVPHFKRGKKESEKAYVRRMEAETKHVLFLTKNQVERKPELDQDQQEKPTEGKSDKKKEYDKGRQQKVQQKKLDRQEEMMEKDMFIDYVPFGEVTLAPPTLSAKPRKAPVKPQKTLLLTSLLGQTVSSTTKPSMARKRIVEEERLRAVEAYRYLKKQKQQQNEARAAGLERLKNLS